MTNSPITIKTNEKITIVLPIKYQKNLSEKNDSPNRRSLFIVKDIKKGERITEENVRSIRPGYGLPPKYMDEVLGQRAVKDIMAGTPLAWEMIANF